MVVTNNVMTHEMRVAVVATIIRAATEVITTEVMEVVMAMVMVTVIMEAAEMIIVVVATEVEVINLVLSTLTMVIVGLILVVSHTTTVEMATAERSHLRLIAGIEVVQVTECPMAAVSDLDHSLLVSTTIKPTRICFSCLSLFECYVT